MPIDQAEHGAAVVVSPSRTSSGMRRFWIGGAGALLPLLVTLLALDLAPIIDHPDRITLGIAVGTTIRYVALFALGGVVALLNSDEDKPIKLVQLGIGAPALIASMLNAGSPAAPRISLLDVLGVGSAYAQDSKQVLVAQGFLGDVLRSVTGSVGNAIQASDVAKQADDVHKMTGSPVDSSGFAALWVSVNAKPFTKGSYGVIVASLGDHSDEDQARAVALQYSITYPTIGFMPVPTVGKSSQWAIFVASGLSQSEAQQAAAVVRKSGISRDAYVYQQSGWDGACIPTIAVGGKWTSLPCDVKKAG